MSLDEIVIATRNEGKTREFAALLGGIFGKVRSLKKFPSAVTPAETGETFAENSAIKARAAYNFFAPKRSVIADDSGLEVFSLNSQPGIFSARYAGERATDEENVSKLLSELKGEKDRRARFVCHLTAILSGGQTVCATGFCSGVISSRPKGAGGFGYDPVFFVPSLRKTFAEISPDEKNRLSHRAVAVREFLSKLTNMRVKF